MTSYNYPTFDMANEMAPFQSFPNNLHPGQKAPSFPLEDLDTGASIEMSELWRSNLLVIEFGSFT